MFINTYKKTQLTYQKPVKTFRFRFFITSHMTWSLPGFPSPKKLPWRTIQPLRFLFYGAKGQMSKHQLWNIAVMLLVHFNGQTFAWVEPSQLGGITMLFGRFGRRRSFEHDMFGGFWSMEDDLIEIYLDLPVWVPNKNGSVAQTCQLTTR